MITYNFSLWTISQNQFHLVVQDEVNWLLFWELSASSRFLNCSYSFVHRLYVFILPFFVFSEGKISADEPAILPPQPLLVPKNEKRRSFYGTPQSKRIDFREREWDRERDRDFELMPPPGIKKDFNVPLDVDQPIDPNEPTYCVCHQVLTFTFVTIFSSKSTPFLESCLASSLVMDKRSWTSTKLP